MADNRRETGRLAETAVVGFLESRGFVILERNYRKRTGEIDLIAKKGNRIHFIEIKSRRKLSGPSLMESWSGDQRERFVNLADTYLAEHPELSRAGELEVSLDYAAVQLNDDDAVMDIDYIEDAFRPD